MTNDFEEQKLRICSLQLKYSSLQLQRVSLEKLNDINAERVTIMIGAQKILAGFQKKGSTIIVEIKNPVLIQTHQAIIIIELLLFRYFMQL